MANVVFVRGANVGGHNKFSTAKVAASLKRLRVHNVGAAGTFVVKGPGTATVVRGAFVKALPAEAVFAVIPSKAIQDLIDAEPFSDMPTDTKAYVSVLMGPTKAHPTVPFEKTAEAWAIRITAIHGRLVLSLQNRKVKQVLYPNEVVESLLGVPSTTRGWPTFERIGKILAG